MERAARACLGVLATCLSFAALSATVTAAEPEVLCRKRVCGYAIRGSGFTMRFEKNRFKCEVVRGGSNYETTTTSHLRLYFRGCSERVDGIGIACTTDGRASGVIAPAAILAHDVFLPSRPGAPENEPGIFGNAFINFTCGGLVRVRAEGIINGIFGAGACGVEGGQTELFVRLLTHAEVRGGKPSGAYDLSFNDNRPKVIVPWTRVGFWEVLPREGNILRC
jgi:hypothetical protein